MNGVSIFAVGIVLVSSAGAQVVVDQGEDLNFERPEAWAMAYMSSAAMFHGFGPARRLDPGSVGLGLEAGHIPRISAAKRRVGFDGTKLEDLNKSPVFGRVRLWLGLPAGFSLELGWTPPVTVNGATPRDLFGFAVERPLVERERWRVGARVSYVTGRVRGDITCDRETASHPPGSPENPFGCREPSNDRYEIESVGLELSVSANPGGGRIEPYGSIAVTSMEPRTRVNAQTFGVIDRSLLTTRGTVRTFTAGVVHRPAPDWELLAAAAWTPLKVRRPPGRNRDNDDLLSVRLMMRRQFW